MKVTFLGQGPFAIPIRQAIEKNFGLVPISQAEIVVVASWGKILSKDEIDQPKFGILNIHPSLLPQYRGATPIQWSIINGDKKSGLTIIKMDEHVDHGPIIAQAKIRVGISETSQTLEQKLAKLGAAMIVKILPQYVSGMVKPIEQDHAKATYVYRFKKADGQLNLDDPAEVNERKIRALWPWPGAWVCINPSLGKTINPQKLFIHKAHVVSGRLIPDLVQLEGRVIISWDDFSRGWHGNLPQQLSSLVADHGCPPAYSPTSNVRA